MGELGFCTTNDIIQAVFRQLIADISADGNVPIMLVRLVHNKLFFSLFFSLRCYLFYFDASLFARYLSPILWPYIIYALVSKRWRRLFLISLFIFPIFMMFNPFKFSLGTKYYVYLCYYMVLAILGGLKIILDKR